MEYELSSIPLELNPLATKLLRTALSLEATYQADLCMPGEKRIWARVSNMGTMPQCPIGYLASISTLFIKLSNIRRKHSGSP
jgi:hypothetical protein